LGHPSLKVTKLVLTVDARKGSNILNKLCNICHQAKHNRDSFPISDSKASNMFELIHCDFGDFIELLRLVVLIIS